MKIQIHTHIYEKLKTLAQAHNITMSDLANSLLEKMLNRHHEDLKKIIREMKQKWYVQFVGKQN